MDPLSDLLRVARLTGAHFFPASASGPWGLVVPEATALRPGILPGSEHLLSYHLVVDGRCWGGLTGESLSRLEAGDVILFAHGDAHVMSGRDEIGPDARAVTSVPRFPAGFRLGDTVRPDVTLICGFFGCAREPFNPLCAGLPRQVIIRASSSGMRDLFARQVIEEAGAGRAGSDSMLTRLAELMFIDVLRRYLAALPTVSTGWLAGLRDPLVGRVLALLHERPAHPWTLAELATAAAASRSSLVERFTSLVGVAPMQYLTQWRMQIAAGRLTESGAKLATVAAEVGYESEAAFSRAFKRATGSAPGQWRARNDRSRGGSRPGI